MKSGAHKERIVWQKGIKLVIAIYKYISDLPKEELYGLTSKMRRAAISIPSNVAEGKKRGTARDFRQFLLISFGSGAEMESQLEISRQLQVGNEGKRLFAEEVLSEVMRMLNTLIHNLRVPAKLH